MGYRIKWRFLVKLAIVLLLAGGTIYFVHRWQVKSQVGAFLYQADLALAAAEVADKGGNPKAAGEEREREQAFLQRYLLARPDAMDVRERLARLMCKNAKTGRQALNAYFVLEDVLRRDESRDDLRRFTIDYAMNRLGMFKEAKDHLTEPDTRDPSIRVLKKQYETDGELRGLYARCLTAERNFKDAETQYDFACRHRPDMIDSFAGLALVRRQLNDPKKSADDAIRDMMVENKKNFRAYLYAAEYMREFGLPELEPKDKTVPPFVPGKKPYTRAGLIEVALQNWEKELDTLLAAADLARAQARKLRMDPDPEIRITALAYSEEARGLLTRAVELHPSAENPYLAMAALEAEERQVADAIQVVRKGLEKDELKDSPRLLHGLMEYQFQAGDAAGASETLKRLQERGLQPGVEEFELARVMILEDKWKEAAASLDKAVLQLQGKPALVRQAHLLLGRCYAELGDNERRLREYNLALPEEVATPQWSAAMIGIAESETALGRLDEALKTYRKATDWFPALWVPVARLELVRVLRSTDAKPNWDPVDQALKEADNAASREGGRYIPDTTDLMILKATLQHYKGDPVKARAALESLRKDHPKNVAVRVELAMQRLREGKDQYPEALSVLDLAVKELGDSLEIRLAKARVWAAMNVRDLSAILTDLAFKTDSLFPPGTTEAAARTQKRRLVRGLAEIASASGADEAASRLWTELAVAKPFDISVHLIRFERANRAGNVEEMKSILAQIAQLDGEQGRTTRLARVALLIRDSEKSKNRELLNQALQLLDALEREPQGPSNGRVVLLQGVIHDLNGNSDLAKAKYRQAIERGELNPDAVRRQIELLSSGDEQEAEEARALIDKLKNAKELGPDFQRLAAGVSLRADDAKAALEFARRAANENSKKYQDQLFLGHVYWRSKDANNPPEPRFRRATELAPEVMHTWLSLIQYLLATGKKDKATEVIEEAREKVNSDDRALFAALSYAQLGETKKATEAFEQARKARPGDVRILTAEAEYLLQTARLAEARAGFDRVLDSASATPEQKAVARERKALATAADPDHSTALQAVRLLPLTGNETPGQLRARAVVLGMQRVGEHKREAIRLLEQNKQGSTPSERFILAQLYHAVGYGTKLQLTMEELLKREGDRQPLYLRFYARWLLREGDLSKAERWIDELAKKDPDGLGTAELKARLAAARKDLRGAWEALRSKEKAPNAPIAVIAGICEDIGLHDEAERLSKQFVDQHKQSQPRVVLGLAEFYGRRGRTAEGLQICDEMRGKLPMTMVGAAAINVLYNAQSPSSAEVERVVGWLDSATQKAAGQERAALLQLLAAIRNLQGRYDDAAGLYEEVLRSNPRDALALNNLAYLLSASKKKGAEALALIAQAKQILGDHTVLLDTEALILLNSNRPKDALPLMEDVVKRAPSGSAFFHLAQVEFALEHELDAKAAWREAQERGLKRGDLHPLEWAAHDELAKRLN